MSADAVEAAGGNEVAALHPSQLYWPVSLPRLIGLIRSQRNWKRLRPSETSLVDYQLRRLRHVAWFVGSAANAGKRS